MADKQSKIPKEPLNLRFPVETKRRLQHWCIDHEREMTEILVALAERMLDGKIAVPPAPKKPRRDARKK